MRRNTMVFGILLAVTFIQAAAFSGETKPREWVTLGRPFLGRPWLTDANTAPATMEKYNALPISQVIKKNTDIYKIHSDVKVAGYSYFFDVRGIDADYTVGTGIGLAKLIHELGVIEELKNRHKGKEYASGVADGVKGMGTGIANLVTKPGQSFKGLGEKLRKTGRSIERAVGTEEKVGADSTGHDRSHLGSGPAGQARRLLAYQVGVDVYTSNPVLQKLLTELSHVYMAGSITTWVVPMAISAMSHFNLLAGDPEAEIMIRDYEPYELRRVIGKNLEPIMQMDREDKYLPLNRWLMNPNFSPRNIAYIGLSLANMRETENLPLILEELSKAAAPEEADLWALELRLFALLNRNIQKIHNFILYRSMLAGFGTNGVLYVMFPGDTLRPWDEPKQAFAGILEDVKSQRLGGVEIWALGDVHPSFMQMAEEQGVIIHDHVLRNQNFYKPVPTTQPEVQAK